MLIISLGIVLTALSVFSLWGGTPVPLGALMEATSIGVSGFGVIRMVREVVEGHYPSGEARSPHRSG